MTAIDETPQTAPPKVPRPDDAPPRWRQGVGSGRLDYWTFTDSDGVLGLVGNRTDEPDKYTAEPMGRIRHYNLPPGPFRTLRDAQVAVEQAWLKGTPPAGVSASPHADSPIPDRQPATTGAAPLKIRIRAGLLFGGVRPYLEPEEYSQISRRLATTGEGGPWRSFADFGSTQP